MEIDGERLRRARDRAALTIRELAERSGVSASTIWHLEAGRREARPSTARKLAEILGVAPAELLAGPAARETTRGSSD